MTDSPSAPERLLSLVTLAPFASELAQIAARGTLEGLGAEANRRWSFRPERVLRNLTAANADLVSAIQGLEDEVGANVTSAARAVAQGWEDFARIAAGPDAISARISAAINYEIAGYQANASCLAREFVSPRQWTTEPTLLGVASAFLQRLYIRVHEAVPSLTAEPALGDGVARDEIIRRAAMAIAALGLDTAARALMTGDTGDLDVASQRLQLAEVGFAEVGDVLMGSVAFGLRHVLPVMRARSTWTHLAGWSDSERWRRYLRILGRGTGSQILDARSVSELWPSQIAALDAGLLAPRTGSLVVRMPTSAGKTRVAEMALIHALANSPGSKCVYVAPFRALASEIESSLALTFSDVGYGASTIPGAFDQDAMGELLADTDDVLVVTPEKLDLLVRLQPELLAKIVLVVVDEGHIVGDRERGPKFELLISRLRSRLPQARFLYMSAVVPDATLRQFAKWLGDAEGYVSASWRPTVLRHAQLDWTGTSGTLRYARPDVVVAGIDFVPGVIVQRVYEHRSPETGYIRRPRFPNPTSKGEIAAELAYTYATRGPVLIFCMLTDWAKSTAQALLRRIELADLTGEDIHSQFRLRTTGRALAVASEWLGSEHEVVGLLRRGIAFHHARLPTAVRETIELDFRESRLSAIVATSTLAQGVNLPINTVIFHSCRTQDDDGELRRLSTRDYWNIAGRAGRAGHETRGLAIHLVRTANDRDDFEHYSQARDAAEPVQSGLIDLLLRLVRDRISAEEVAAKLDSDLLALLVEEMSPEEASQTVAETLGSSLFAIQAEEGGLRSEALVSTMTAQAQRIVQSVPDVGLRSVYASTGLSSVSCAALLNHVTEHTAELYALYPAHGADHRSSFTDLLVEGLSRASEMEPRAQFDGDESTLRAAWLEGRAVAEIASDLDLDSMNISQFIEDYYAYRLPWGISGYFRIVDFALEGIEASAATANLAGMVKYGVPTEEAVWAMTAGVPSRRSAIQIAAAFVEDEVQRSPGAFRRWLGTLETEELADRFALAGLDLELTARAVLRSHSNEYLARLGRR